MGDFKVDYQLDHLHEAVVKFVGVLVAKFNERGVVDASAGGEPVEFEECLNSSIKRTE